MFIDEIGDVQLAAQAKLLRLIQESFSRSVAPAPNIARSLVNERLD